MPYDTTVENLAQKMRKVVEINKGELIGPLKARQCTNCQDMWPAVIKLVGDDIAVQYVMRVVTRKNLSMPNYAHANLRELCKAICARAAYKRRRGDVMRGHEELMEAIAANMPELNADLREHEESLQRDALDPIAAIA